MFVLTLGNTNIMVVADPPARIICAHTRSIFLRWNLRVTNEQASHLGAAFIILGVQSLWEAFKNVMNALLVEIQTV